MWAKIIRIKRTKDLNYFSLCALNLFNTRVSQFELNYWFKWTFPRHSNLLKRTCMYTVSISSILKRFKLLSDFTRAIFDYFWSDKNWIQKWLLPSVLRHTHTHKHIYIWNTVSSKTACSLEQILSEHSGAMKTQISQHPVFLRLL